MLNYNISFWRLLTLFIFLFAWKIKFVNSISNQSHLCEAMDMPCVKGNSGECLMKYYKLNSTDCKNLFFHGKTTEDTLGNFNFQSYHYNKQSYKQTGFNLTFSNISWSHLKFRFKQEGNERKNTCREFFMLDNSTVKNIFYDCLWSNEAYEGTTFTLEYEATDKGLIDYKKYSFRVPFAKSIDDTTELKNWEIFIFVEKIKTTFGMTKFVLHWQPLPEKFSIDTYKVSVMTNVSGQSHVIHSSSVACKNFSDCKYCYTKRNGNVQFGIQPICLNNLKCFVSKTDVFVLAEGSTLLICIVSATLIIPAMIYVLFLLRNYFVNKTKKWKCPVPKVLLVFTPSISPHVKVVFALVEYLKIYCNVEPLLDELHIFHSKSRDPFKWCNEAFKSADCVLVVASPYYKHLRLADSVYQNTDLLLLRLLQERLASRDKKKRFSVLMLPYCSEKDIPNEAINLRRFLFPQDLNKMLKFIHRDESFTDCLSSEIQGGKENYKLFGKKLNKAISEAQTCLQNNRSDYDKMVEEIKNEKEIDSDQALLTGIKQNKEKPSVCKALEHKKIICEDMFSEFPGHIEEMNLSGGEEESLVNFQLPPKRNNINLDDLDL